jgi:hypothetical protein
MIRSAWHLASGAAVVVAAVAVAAVVMAAVVMAAVVTVKPVWNADRGRSESEIVI